MQVNTKQQHVASKVSFPINKLSTNLTSNITKGEIS